MISASPKHPDSLKGRLLIIENRRSVATFKSLATQICQVTRCAPNLTYDFT